ncbi:MAG: hypothetical protein JXQ71_17760 [Verrucomicrobia bacterium]|nr:hypothetical protein [Verrucomicrobiota bacterium]
MNTKLTYGLATALALAAVYGVVSWRKQAELRIAFANAEAKWQAEFDRLEAALIAANAKSSATPRPASTSATAAPAVRTPGTSPQSILDELISLDPTATEEPRNETLRRIVAQFQRLADCGPDALPVIRDFLAKNQDVYYTAGDLTSTGERARRALSVFNPARTDFLVPPSLRLGLIDVLRRIGGGEAETLLAGVLATTGRGVEVAYLTRVLEEMAPTKYRDAAVAAAKELLLNPPPIDSPNRLDDNARAYLYDVLKMYGDHTYVQEAQTKLVAADGSVDRTTLGYLTSLLKEDALPVLHAAYNDPRLTNVFEKSAMLNHALKFVGGHTQANEMLASAVISDAMPHNLRSFIVMSLAGGHRAETPKDPHIIQGRLELLDYLRRNSNDERILRSIDETRGALQTLLEKRLAPQSPPPAETAPAPGAAPGE